MVVYIDMNIEEAILGSSLVIAHRGARSLAPENTLAAARKAFENGAQMWEVDVRVTRDGELVLIHDATLQETTDAAAVHPGRSPWPVHDFTLAELKELDFGGWFNERDPFGQIEAGNVSEAEQAAYRGEQVATLESAIRFTLEHDRLINIELKDLSGLPGHDCLADKVVGLVNSLEALPKVLISSFNHDYLARIKRLDRRIKTGALVANAHRDPVRLMHELGTSTYHPALRAVRVRQFWRMKEKGFGILVWVVNNTKLAQALNKVGASGIFTDFPQMFAG